MNEHQRAERAQRVKELIEDENFKEAVSNVDAAYISAWRNAKTPEAREDLHRKIIALHDVCKDLKAMVMDGAFAEQRIKELEGQKRGPFKIFG